MADNTPEVKVTVEKKNPRKPTKKYELLTARYDGINEKGEAHRYTAGDFVPLTEAEYAAFGDKFGAEESRSGRRNNTDSLTQEGKLDQRQPEPQLQGQRPTGPESQPTTANPQSPGKVNVPADPRDPTRQPDGKPHS